MVFHPLFLTQTISPSLLNLNSDETITRTHKNVPIRSCSQLHCTQCKFYLYNGPLLPTLVTWQTMWLLSKERWGSLAAATMNTFIIPPTTKQLENLHLGRCGDSYCKWAQREIWVRLVWGMHSNLTPGLEMKERWEVELSKQTIHTDNVTVQKTLKHQYSIFLY